MTILLVIYIIIDLYLLIKGIFRKCDDLGYEIAIMEAVEEDGIGMAIMNRARRAAKK